MVRAFSAVLLAPVAAKTVQLATFDGAKETTLPFVPVNDPVMGGSSKSSFTVDSNKGVFEGEVKVVTFLGSPGFCNLEAPGFRQPAITFPDISGTDGIALQMDQTLENGLTNWDVSLQTETSKKASRTGDAGWQANFEFKAGQTSYFVPYSAFTCSSRGQKLSTCGDLSKQLNELTQLGVGTDGVAGPFRVELTSIEATTAPLGNNAEIKLVTFDEAEETTLTWRKTLDPVMGGASTGDFTVSDGVGKFAGTCNIVKSLAAPGFAKIEGTGRTLADVTGTDSLLLKVRSSTPEYQGFKVAFGAPGIPSGTIFQRNGAYKTEFYLENTADWQVVEVPLGNFSRDTSDYTGRCDTKDPRTGGKQHYCCSQSPLQPSKDEVCVEDKYLSQINDLQLWAEGVEGDFDLEIEYIGAKPASSVLV